MSNNESLHQKIVALVGAEKKLIAEIVEHVAEADRRRLYLDYGYTSLFAYLTSLGYSPACAQSRVDAARMLNEVPSISEDLRSGSLNLSQIMIVARTSRQREVATAEKLDVLQKIRGRDVRSSEQIVCESLNIPPTRIEKKRVQADESVRVEVTFSKEQWELLERAKEVVSHINPNPSMAELVEYIARDFLKKKDPTSDPKSQRVISARRQIFRQHRCCQWRFKNGNICGSRFQLQVDHVHSKWAGGSDHPENLQLLCAAHNRLKYRLGG